MRTWTFWGSLIQYPSTFYEFGMMAMMTWGLPCMKDPLHGGVKPWLKPTCLMRPSNLPDLHRFSHLEEDRQAWPQQSKPEPELPHWALGSQARVPSYHSAKTPNLLGYFNHISSQKDLPSNHQNSSLSQNQLGQYSHPLTHQHDYWSRLGCFA